ncbi:MULTISPECIES: bifunctional phosphoribosyl-AMP cyclohydrolase/phosphoribosyl-ATP diphosphatase HisIE [unclassified Thermosynechococcus]|uniref:bifunctional phosphoribosyl-AMP cyclohydrolase/phosphoribosyl-ATP diphosphatase HisIE n=1 Tax=unclassified Thermosynechococcus TaxID=2622553 RepID=UPI0019812481|nr:MULTISPECIES: bifunctional phosphoribosyl-AMP cyclohydrolase/phosphoribosyl-ATP diphosphatase HisIE [unclassified Thermosynechococcus]QSF49792.1 bifunctional phosphoribosyl-AMP cyclohydrolase/phosphoribosyl-ATP diphosphatase HisIE [Thermosynechococcus sp. TA-1]WNC53353.1 bifunctional phosphoribosyl-AMP cyclohydrolase/phosphoribosyl-ATP diphosphatase HisIE [Thermosynechococcus sp. TG215]WNC58446.1 bifunctional phosphoribosyl-AMP cyclohydrolase/phosphoribosyl-ATP diphosphatase HisIE [Thermosyne
MPVTTLSLPLDEIRYDERGLVPAIVQDYLDGTVLMLAWMNRESLQKTLETGRTWFWSRSRQELWPKGETSGHVQWVKSIRYDCDSDALLLTVEQVGKVACHTGQRSCFHRHGEAGQRVEDPPADTLSQVYNVVCQRRDFPQLQSYTSSLFTAGDNKILKKLGEETVEVVMACKDDDPEAIASEVADLFYHTLVALAYHGVSLRQVYEQLQLRRR